MKIRLFGLTCLFVLALSSTALATHPSTKNAITATYNEINNNSPTQSDNIRWFEKENIHCNRLTSTKYHCTFHFIPLIGEQNGCADGEHGYSYVTFRRYGPEVYIHLNYNECREESYYR